MANPISLHSFSHDQFKELFKEIFQEVLSSNPNAIGGGSIDGQEFIFDSAGNLKPTSNPKTAVKYLTRKQVAHLLQISLPTLHEYTKAGILTSYRIGKKRVRYKASVVEEALKERSYQFRKKGGAND